MLSRLAKSRVSQIYLVSDGKTPKVLKLFGAEYTQRAEREFRIGRRLRHPHLGAVERWLEPHTRPAVLMDYVPGSQLMRWCRNSEVGLRDYLGAMHGVIRAIGYLHDQNVLHRDLKPDNILVDRQQHARLIDFDLAVDKDAQQRTRDYLGTLLYLSPEQTYGEILDETSDLYSLGVVLYRGVTGQMPFVGSPEEVLRAHRSATPPPPSQIAARLEPFDPFFARLLAKDPGERHQRADEVFEHLHHIENQLAI